MAEKYLSLEGVQKLWNALVDYVDGKESNSTEAATDTDYGAVKTNSEDNITLDEDGKLVIGGRLGKDKNGTGLYSPASIAPIKVGDGSLLITEANRIYLGNKSLSVSTGRNLTLSKPAPAGTKEYYVKDTYVNRLACAGLLVSSGVIAIDEANADKTVSIESISFSNAGGLIMAGQNSDNTFYIRTTDSVNPDKEISSIRLYPAQKEFSNLFVGQGVGGGGGASIIAGQGVTNASGNANVLAGADIYNYGNGNACFGRQHLSSKNRSFLAGTGHNTTNARSEAVAAFGQWSNIASNTLFAIGNGTSNTARKNAFEVTDDGGIVLTSPGGTKYKVTVNNSGTLSTTKV